MKTLDFWRRLSQAWTPPQIPNVIPHGDMPGDQVRIEGIHIQKAQTLFPFLVKQVKHTVDTKGHGSRVVISICGGSGVGKSEIASVLGWYFCDVGLRTYILSGDNYPHRIPRDNDLERLRVFRTSGLRELVNSGQYTRERGEELRRLWLQDLDADVSQSQRFPWISAYQSKGRSALREYLGTPNEICFDEVDEILSKFKNGSATIALKRMGREITELWYDLVDFSETDIVILEWTHGNSDHLHEIDIPVLLNSTPAETLAHRRARNRDGKTDSAFTTMVLEIEQEKLEAQAHKAKLILSKAGELLTYQQYCDLMIRTKE